MIRLGWFPRAVDDWTSSHQITLSFEIICVNGMVVCRWGSGSGPEAVERFLTQLVGSRSQDREYVLQEVQ